MEIRLGGGNSPLGENVWLAGTDQKIGMVTHTYNLKTSQYVPAIPMWVLAQSLANYRR